MTPRRTTRPVSVEQLQARLVTAVEDLATSPAWQAMLTVASRLPTYSPANVMLIAAQRPDATRVAGYRAWAQLGRQVRAGEHGIAILAPVLRRSEPPTTDSPAGTEHPAGSEPAAGAGRWPGRVLRGFRPTYVFDISQTDGLALPPTTPALLSGPAPLVVWADMLTQVEAAGYRVGEADLAPANGLTDFTDFTVTVHRGLAPAQKTKTLAHELAHVRLHAPRVRPPGMARAVAEIEAESVAYIVTAAHGITSDAYSVPYVTGWARGDSTRVASTATRVLSCARAVLRHTDPTAAANNVLSVVRDRDRPGALTAEVRQTDPAVRAVDR